MKLTELVAELQTLAKSHPNVDVDFKWIEYIGNGTTTRSVAYLDAKIVDGHAVIRTTDPVQAPRNRRYTRPHTLSSTKAL